MRTDGLQLEEHLRLQVRQWRGETVAWGVFLLLMILALAGAFASGGPLARKSVEMATASIDAPRFLRWQTPDRLTIRFASTNDAHRLEFGSGFSDAFTVEGISPQPNAQAADAERLVLDVAASAGGRTVVTISPDRVGPVSFTITVDGTTERIGTFIWP